jgi:DNA adenine methylase
MVYTEEDYSRLLKLLERIKGKFLLSSYPSEVLNGFIKRNGWQTEQFEQGVSVNNKGGYRKRKVEELTRNYAI